MGSAHRRARALAMGTLSGYKLPARPGRVLQTYLGSTFRWELLSALDGPAGTYLGP